MYRKLKRYLHSPYYEIGRDIMQRWPRIMPDTWFIKVQYLNEVGCKVNLKEPHSFTEKMQWFKLHDHNPLYTTLVDKYKVKTWVTERIGAGHIIPTLAVWKSSEEIDISILPDRFVLKCNHDCGSVIICKNKNLFNIDEAKKKLSVALNKNHYYFGREWPYKHVEPKIIAEPYITNTPEIDALTDYKFFCFNGIPRVMLVVKDRQTDRKIDVYDMDFNLLPTRQRSLVSASKDTVRPYFFDELKSVATILAENLPVCRVDMYYTLDNQNVGHVILGEMTLYDGSGYDPFVPEEWNIKIGDMIELPCLKH